MSASSPPPAVPHGAPATEVHPQAAFSVLALGAGVLVVLSFAIPEFEPPFGAEWYMSILAGSTAVLGGVAALRQERGPLARLARTVAIGAAGLFVLTLVLPEVFVLLTHLFMPN